MALPVSNLNGVKVYNLSAGKTLPQWLENTKSVRALRYNQDFRTRIELIQDLEFPCASTQVKVSKDGKYLVASGVYPPQVKVFDLDELSMKFERHIDGAVVQMQVLSSDFSKLVFLRDDRFVEFHARYGRHHQVRIPKFGRDMMYQKSVCDLYLVGADSEAWRFNLEQGQFLQGIQTNLTEINVCDVNPAHELLGFGGTNDCVEFYDPRDRACISRTIISESVNRAGELCKLSDKLRGSEITSLRFDGDGLTYACGTDTGHVLLYDLRTSIPLMARDHRYGLPIKDIRFHEKSGKILSADSKIIKLWDRKTFEPFTSIQPKSGINSTCVLDGTGLLFAAAEQPRVLAFYVPALGPAPKWCSFLDSITEELEEERSSTGDVLLYDDYKFVTREELARLGLEHLIGTKLLRAYMHGFFMDIRLYKQVRAALDPFEYKNYIKERVQKKLEEERSQRITIKRKTPKVNKEFAEALLSKKKSKSKVANDDEEQESKSKAESTKDDASINPLGDDRFGELFKNPDFEIDFESEEFRRLHPSGRAKVRQDNSAKDLEDDRFDLVRGSHDYSQAQNNSEGDEDDEYSNDDFY